MKNVFPSIVACMLALSMAFHANAQVQPPKKQQIVPEKIEVTGGKLICIDASKAKGDVLFDADKGLDSAIIDGKKLYVCVPKNEEAKCYHVSVISWDDKTRDVVKIIVLGEKEPIDPPFPDPTKAILDRLDKIETRITILESAKPTPNTTLKHLTFVGAEVNSQSIAINNDAALRATLKLSGVNVHVVSKSNLESQSAGFIKAVNDNGGVPIVVMQDSDGTVIGTCVMTNVKTVTDAVNKHLKR